MSRIYRNVTVDQNLLRRLEEELEANKHLLSADENSLTRDHLLFIRSLSPLISRIDPRYNGGDYTLAHKWFYAEDEGDDYTEYHNRLQIVRALLRFCRAKIADVGGRTASNPDNDIRTTYTVVPIDESLLDIIRAAMPELTEIRQSGKITPENCEQILDFTSIIELVDLKFSGSNLSRLPKGLSLGERWDLAAYWDCEELLPESPDDCAEFFERFYTILYSLVRHGTAVIIHSPDGQLCYPTPIYPEQI